MLGAGLSGLLMGIRLKKAGIRDFTIYEKADSVGGTWRDNRYPGLTCDVPSRLYCYSFFPHGAWSRFLPPGEEVLRYLRAAADRFGIRAHIKFNTEVVSLRWGNGRWSLRSDRGDEGDFHFVVAATGFLHHPARLGLAGLQSFKGAVVSPSRWPPSIELGGRRVGVVGTGSSGTQIASAVAEQAGQLTVFCRSPQWVFPLPNWELSRLNRGLMGRFPALSKAAHFMYRYLLDALFGKATTHPGWQRALVTALCRAHLRGIRDPLLRQQLTPKDVPMCKRLVFSNEFYRAIQRSNVSVIRRPIDRVYRSGIEAGGVQYRLDVLVLATGFDSHTFMSRIHITGQDGRDLRDVWAGFPLNYRTMAVPGFPNLFMIIGPNSPFGHVSVPSIAETQTAYIMQLIGMFTRGLFTSAGPTEEAAREFQSSLDEAMPRTAWAAGCSSWYRNEAGYINTYPWSGSHFRNLLATVNCQHFTFE
ncbi:NAD(P)/FAD-dependent oxidoreductase [Streptomyces olivaceiscleroticus]|uniref:NAD(P)/FAD-dependent oxidoreductase n=1 Tax=Streptomyces olivaceiscleroticus TaxID=68245 RepID=A0ABN0ZYU8_9ACTN